MYEWQYCCHHCEIHGQEMCSHGNAFYSSITTVLNMFYSSPVMAMRQRQRAASIGIKGCICIKLMLSADKPHVF